MPVSRRTLLQTAAIAGFAGTAAAADPIKIGIPVALTGPLGGIGTQMRRGCDFWAKQVNAKGGILGRPVELIVEDTAANPATTVRKVQEMVERSGVRLIQLETGPLQHAAIRLYERAGYLLIPNFGKYTGDPNSVCYEKAIV